jgi:hypothetical protein
MKNSNKVTALRAALLFSRRALIQIAAKHLDIDVEAEIQAANLAIAVTGGRSKA